MKKNIFIISFLLLSGHSYSQSISGCIKFKTGKFSYFDSTYNTILVTRKKNTQTEYNANEDITVKYKVEWVSDCEYHLKQFWSDSKSRRKLNGQVNTVIISKIIDDNSYESTCGCEGVDVNKKIMTMTRVR